MIDDPKGHYILNPTELANTLELFDAHPIDLHVTVSPANNRWTVFIRDKPDDRLLATCPGFITYLEGMRSAIKAGLWPDYVL